MNHANLKALILSNQKRDGKLMHVHEQQGTENIIVKIYYGADIVSRPDGSWNLTMSCNNLNQAAVDILNVLTNEHFVLKKTKTRTFQLNKNFLTDNTVIEFQPNGDWHILEGVIYVDDLKEKTKELHKLTRRFRKIVQPQLRLLGDKAFHLDPNQKQYHYGNKEAEIEALINLLDGVNVVKNLKLMRDIGDMYWEFGCGTRWNRNSTSEFNPRKIVDKILRRVGTNKLAILEKYDERKRSTNRSKDRTRRAA